MTPPVLDVPSGRPAGISSPDPGDPRLERLAVNQRTLRQWSLREVVQGCARRGVGAVGLWREPVHELGVATCARLVRDAGLRVSTYCRGGFLTGPDHRAALQDNRRAIDEAAELGASCLVMVVGGLPEGSRDLSGARQAVTEGVAELAPYAAQRGVRLGLEPLHPVFCADRSVLCSLSQALDLADEIALDSGPPAGEVGVVVDAYHVWWDPDLASQVTRAGRAGRVFSFQTCDWILPLPADTLLGRGIPGDGHIDLRGLRQLVDTAGYGGDIEVEVFNADVWAADGAAVLDTIVRRHIQQVL